VDGKKGHPRPPRSSAGRKSMKKKKQKKNVPFAFIQDFGTYQDDMFVIVGAKSREDIVKVAKSARIKKSLIKYLSEGDIGTDFKEAGSIVSFTQDGTENMVLFLHYWKNCWDFWETLMHELHHVVHFHIAVARRMEKEAEALAYQQEYLFRSIRRKLQGTRKFKKYT